VAEAAPVSSSIRGVWMARPMRLFASGDFLSRYVAYLALALVIIVFGVLAPDRFLTTANLEVVLQNTAVLCIVAIGMTFIIIGGSIDLSVGSVMALSGAITASFTAALGAWAFVMSPIVGTILGVISGCIFVFGRIPSFVVSLGMLSMARGATILYTGGTPVSIPLDSAFYVFGTPPVPFIIAAVTAIVAAALMRTTTFGRYTYAIGGDDLVRRAAAGRGRDRDRRFTGDDHQPSARA
jgi:ribose/xylose/arabinose/galactoside ABC-type transport system permease subunit